MSEPKDAGQDQLLDHNYDGIQEYDNPMPGWWVYLFVATILFSVLYALNLPGIGVGRGRIAGYEAEMAKARAASAASAPPAASLSDADLRSMANDPAKVALGKATFETNCVACHRADGGGLIGPDLTDDYWIHGGAPTRILATVTNGVLDKGMPTWGPVLKPDQIPAVTAYVLTLHGTHPPDPKASQGVKEESGAADVK
jgi:cytochrome c oxidase cbb3-type subunit 3